MSTQLHITNNCLFYPSLFQWLVTCKLELITDTKANTAFSHPSTWTVYFSPISFLDESHLEITVCFSKKDVDTLFPLKTIRQSCEEFQSVTCSPAFQSSPTELLCGLGKIPHSLQVWILVGTRDTQTAHCKWPVCFLVTVSNVNNMAKHPEQNCHLFFHSPLTKHPRYVLNMNYYLMKSRFRESRNWIKHIT